MLAVAERRREGRLEFHDLLVLARSLLRDSADARAALHDRYSRLLIDEFQDTDPIQIELAMLIAASVGGGPVPDGWSDIVVDPERLFFVGDPKQSIYRFRRADIGLFLDARDRFATEAVRLTTNFRTVPPLVAWVNEVFGGLMAEERPRQQPKYEPLAAHRVGAASGHRVQLLGRPHTKDDKLRAGELRELEAATVADAIAGILAEPEAWPVEDAGVWRAARPEDIAILLPTRTSLGFLMDALRARGVEFRAETGTLVYETQEIRDLIAILRSVAHGADAVALVAALRSPILGCGDDDLVTYAAAGGRWDLGAVRPDLDPTHPVMAALDVPRRPAGGPVVDGAEHVDRTHRAGPAGHDARVRRASGTRRLATDPLPRGPGPAVRGVAVGRPRRVRGVDRPPALRHGAGPRTAPPGVGRPRRADHDHARRQGPGVPDHGPVRAHHRDRPAAHRCAGAVGRRRRSTSPCARTSPPTASTGAPTSRRRWTGDEKLRLLYVACTAGGTTC